MYKVCFNEIYSPIPAVVPMSFPCLASDLSVIDGFKVTKLHSVDSKSQGSWVSLCFGPQGNIYTCDQYGSLFRISLNKSGIEKIKKLESPGKAQGLLWAYGSLYMMSNYQSHSIIHRLWDKDND